MVIELDGNVHMNSTSEENDAKRDYELRQLGLIVLRFENKMVFDFLLSVLMEIKDSFRNKGNKKI